MAADKGLRLRIRPSNLWLHSDPVLLHRVLLNLVSNAVQHTHQGSVLVVCRPARGQVQARIEVMDSGIGIAPEHHEKIFEEFFQINNHERDRAKGLGLGLSLVDRTCRLLNHPLDLRSALGCGTRFTVRVPISLARPIDTPIEDVAEWPVQPETAELNVMLIEDDALGSAALKGLLESWGYLVSTADGAQAACDLLVHGSPLDFLVSDYRLRGALNGIEAVRLVRQAVGHEVAACIISGDTDTTVRQQVQDAGLVLLQKPVRPAKLRSVLRNLTQAERVNFPAADSEPAG
jgi:CheY-like chemotaxis protein